MRNNIEQIGSKVIEFALSTEYIHLIQLLKATRIVATGGEAKFMVEDRLVKVNGETELRKRAKIVPGDVIYVSGKTIKVI
jgi:ribosome-associated protein